MALFRSEVERLICAHVRSCGDDPCRCQIRLTGTEEHEILRAAEDLVGRGILIGAFPPNPNRRYGIDWGYLAIPRA